MDAGGKKQVGCDGLADVNMPGNEETDTVSILEVHLFPVLLMRRQT